MYTVYDVKKIGAMMLIQARIKKQKNQKKQKKQRISRA
jgi:hypothetical protein